VAAEFVFFASTGFESIAMIGEETKNPEQTLPRALVLALWHIFYWKGTKKEGIKRRHLFCVKVTILLLKFKSVNC
jgi:amino acid transporter